MKCALKGRHTGYRDEALVALDLRMLDQSGAMVIGPARSASQALEGHPRKSHRLCAAGDIKLGDETVDPVAAVLHNGPFQRSFVIALRRWQIATRIRNTPDDREALRRGSVAEP